MATSYGKSSDPIIKDWYTRVLNAGGTAPKAFVGNLYDFVYTLKYNNVWDKLYEVYVLCGGDYTSCLQKLKYNSSNSPTLSVSGFSASTYIASGSKAGFQCNGSARRITTGVDYNELLVNNRSVGVYETSRSASFYSTWIGRESGGGNTAFGPTVRPDYNIETRFLDSTPQANIGVTNSAPAGFLSSVCDVSELRMCAYGTVYSSSATLSTLNGTGNYFVGGGIGGGAYNTGSISLGCIGYSLTAEELRIISSTSTVLMSSIGANV